MCIRKKKNVEPNLDCNTLARPSLFRRAVAWITFIAYVGQPLIVTAQVTADQAAAASKRPVVDVTANGIPLIQIVTPNAAGLSHNQYTQFNVDPSGVILNNSQTTVQTQQAGFVSANPNLVNGSARIILNEVTSTNRSQLNGYTEVAGQPAEVIIANPNGINCNGCGFINASRGVLTTGAPVMGVGGSLDALRVTGGDIQIGTAGLNVGNISQLDIITRSVQVNGQLWANNLNVITGANLVNYNTLGVQIIAGDANKPAVGIDVALLGGMYANKIQLIGTEAGVGVNSLGNLSAQAGNFTLDNVGQITLGGSTTASGNLTVNSNTSITNNGTLYSQQTAQLTSTNSIINNGLLAAQGNLTLNAASLNSSGTLGAGIDANGNATKNGNLSIITQGQTTATGTNIAGSNVSITASGINLAGSQTSARSGIDLNATAGGIDNSNGNLITMLGLAKLNATGNLINGGGQIGSGQDISVTATTLNGNGHIVAGRDTSINLQGNYTNAAGNVIKANRDLAFGTTGTLTNQTALEAVGNLTVNAAGIDNQAGALINSAHTILNTGTGDIANAGRIEGNIVDTYSNNFKNTATVIGNVVSINANNISNLNAAAMIAATQSVNLIVANALVNQDGANILSLGDINIGSNKIIDPTTDYVTGNAASVTNRSATIEAANNLRISATTITNERTVAGLQWGPSWTGTPVVGTPVPGGPSVLSYTTTYANQQFTATTTPAAQLLAGANMRFGGSTLNNNYSDIIAGGTLTAQMAVNNYGPEFLQSTTLSGTSSVYSGVYVPQSGSCGYISVNCTPAHTVWTLVTTPYNPPPTYTPISGLNYTSLNLSPSAYLAAKGNTTVATNAAGTTPLNLSASTITLPSSGLYTIHSQPGQHYLVVTDPRFTSYANFISSDYMLSRLVLDPQMIQKRLGDGFYEQKLVTDQVTAQTGRRYLGDYSDAQSQFIALMNSGVDAAKDFNLAVGVALTTAQINALKHDIVWMVEREVTLPDGTTVSVLAPQVYLTRLHEGDLKPSGALIAANDISITASGITNSGSIQGRNSNVLSAKDITNQDGVIGSQGFTLLKADNDIFNLSGNINGKNVGMAAGRDIINQRTSRNVTRTIDLGQQGGTGFGLLRQAPIVGVVSGTELGLESGINATGSLSMNAGRDISIVAAAIKSGGDATINAGRDLTVGVLTATNSSTTDQYAAARNNVTQHTSSIQTGGNLNLVSGNDMHLTSAALDVGKDAALVTGGDLTLDASKNSSSLRYNTGSAIARFNDETVLGTILKAGGNVTLAATQLNTDATPSGGGSSAGRADGKGNITLQSTDITSKTGTLTIAADANLKIGVTQENHDSFIETHAESSGLFTHTQLVERSESSRTDNVGSNLNANNISITSGKNIEVVGSTASAEHNINVAAMGDVNIAAATNTYGSDSYRHETTTGLQIKDAFNITDSGPDITSKSRTDGTKQSYNRSSLTSNSGNLNIMAGSNLIASGTDLAANAGNLALLAGGTVALLAGQDTLNQSSSTVTVTNPNLFTKQHRTITDTSASLDYLGSTAQGNSVKVTSGNDIVLQAAQLTAGAGGINLDAGADLKLLAATNSASSKHTETLSTDGMIFRANGTSDKLSDRRLDNSADNQQQTAQVTRLTSAGDIATHSARDTLIEASQLNAQGAIDLSAGNAATYNTDGSLKTPATDGKITLAAVKDSDYRSIAEKGNSLLWQSQGGNGHNSETVKLANISAGKGLSVNASGGILLDLPAVPAEAPAPVEVEASLPTTGPDGKPLTKEQKAALIAEREAQAAEKAAQAAEEKTIREAQRLNDHIDHLASQPGQEWIGQLVKTQPDRVRLQQVKAAAEHWDYSHAGLTPEAAAVIVIVVTYFTAGAASTAAAGITGTAATSVASVAVAAGMTTLASQTTLALINNKGDLGKTLDDLGKSDNVKALVTAMVTAGVLQGLSQTININGTSMAKVNAQSSFTDQLQKNVINSAASTTLNHAMYGGDLQQQLEQSFKNAFIDTGAAQGANWIGDMKAKDNFNNFTHKLAHAIAGCAAGAAKSGDCSSGALGAVVGELSAELYGGNRSNTGNPDLPAFKTDTVNFAKMMAGVAVALTGGDAAAINLAAATGGNAAENNWLNHADAEQLKKLKQMQQAGQCDSNCEKSIAGLDLLDKLNNRELINACVNGTTEACKAQIDRDPAALKYGVDNAGVIVVGNIIAKAGDRSKDAMASLGKALEKTQLKPLVNAQGVITGWAVDLGGADPETLRYWAGAGIFVGTEIILPTSVIDLIPGAGKGLTFITRGTERLVVEEATGKVLGKVDDVLVNNDMAATLAKRTDIDQVKYVNAGSKGDWDKAINGKLEPNTGYVLDNGHTYVTDASGKVKEVTGQLDLNKMDRNGYQQCVTGNCGNAGDEGGHLIASSLGGAGDKINLVPQAATLNRNDWRDMEKYFAQQLKDGKQVTVKIDVGYPTGGGVRPNEFKVFATIDGKVVPFRFTQ